MPALVDPDGPRLCVVPSNPAPDGGRVAYFKTKDKVRLRYGVWPKTAGAAKGTICLVNGRTEFIEKYFETIANFQSRGFQVATFDWRGQGGSERLTNKPKLGYVRRFDDYWLDLNSFHSEILLPDCPAPYYLVGHSMGGLVALLATARDRLMFDRTFLSAPMLSIDGLPLGLSAMAALLEAACLVGLGKMAGGRKEDRAPTSESFGGNPLTSDLKRYMRSIDVLGQCPELEISAPSLRWLASAMRAMAHAGADDFAERIKAPVLMLGAARDEVVSTAAIENLGLRMRNGSHSVIAHARHELFMENDNIRGQVFAAFDAFITDRSPV
ncbi:Lysophospholipase L2 [hydrothermal vent metagenome]|uniref:Lysophospholipase L2 n=1 Tax=hydrothermal vent metagenome TaxID=652676 RepID=A0A3B0TVW1_9ZZZZ